MPNVRWMSADKAWQGSLRADTSELYKTLLLYFADIGAKRRFPCGGAIEALRKLSDAPDPTLLRRMVRNLIENAQQHGTSPIEVTVDAQKGAAILRASDCGPVIPKGERVRLFLSFHRVPGTAGPHRSGARPGAADRAPARREVLCCRARQLLRAEHSGDP